MVMIMSRYVALTLWQAVEKKPSSIYRRFNEYSNLFRKIFIFLMVSSLFIATTGFFETYLGYLLLGITPSLPVCFAVFLMTFSVYSLDKITDSNEDAINMPERGSFLSGRRKFVLYYSVAAYSLSMLLIFLDEPLALPIIFIPLAANAVYGSKLISAMPRLKDVPIVKNLVVAISWALVTTLLPAMQMTPKTGSMISSVLYFMLVKVFINAVLFDVRDVEGDREMGIRTMPILLGFRRTTVILLGLNSTLLLCLVHLEGMLKPLALIMVLYGYINILYFSERRSPIALDFFVDGQWMIAVILFSVLKGFGLS